MEFPKKLPREWLDQLRKQSSKNKISARTSIRKSPNKADPTFGKTTIGSSSYHPVSDNIAGSHFVCPEDGVAESISWYGSLGHSTFKAKCAIYKYSDNSLVAQTEELTGLDFLDWHTHNFSEPKPSLSANTEYWLVVWIQATTDYSATKHYDTVSDAGGYQDLPYTGNFLDPWSPIMEYREYSIYCTYSVIVYTLSGYTKDSSGNPLDNCDVVLFDASNDSVVDTTTSDANGYFEFTNLSSAGPYYIRAHKSGTPNVFGATTRDVYANGSIDVYLYEGETTPTTIRLRVPGVGPPTMTQTETFSVSDSMSSQQTSVRTLTDVSTIVDVITPMYQTSLLESVNMWDTHTLSTISMHSEYFEFVDQVSMIGVVQKIFAELFQVTDQLLLTKMKELSFYEMIEPVDAVNYISLVTQELSETISLQDTFQFLKVGIQVRTFVESIGITDDLLHVEMMFRTLIESQNISDMVNTVILKLVSFYEIMNLLDTLSSEIGYVVTFSESTIVEDMLSKHFENIFEEFMQFVLYPTLVEYEYFIGEDLDLIDTFSWKIRLLMIFDEILETSDILSYEKFGIKIQTLSETFGLIDVWSRIVSKQLTLTDIVQLEDVMVKARQFVLQNIETFQTLDALSYVELITVTLLDSVLVEDILSSIMQYIAIETETITLEDILSRSGVQVIGLDESIKVNDFVLHIILQIFILEESIVITDILQTVTKAIIYCKELVDVEDILSRTIQLIITTQEFLIVEDVFSSSGQYLKELLESMEIVDRLSVLARNLICFSEMLNVLDTISATGILHQTFSEIMQSKDILNVQTAVYLMLEDMISLDDTLNLDILSLFSEVMLLDDILTKVLYAYHEIQLAEMISLKDLSVLLFSHYLFETFDIMDYTTFVGQYLRQLLEEAIMSDALNLLARGLVVLYETVNMFDTLVTTGTWHRTCIETMTFTDNLIMQFLTHKVEFMSIEDVGKYISGLVLTLSETIKTSDVYSGIMGIMHSLFETLNVEDFMSITMGTITTFEELIDASDLMTISGYYQLIENVIIQDMYTRQMEILRVCIETLELTVGISYRVPGTRILKEVMQITDSYLTIEQMNRVLIDSLLLEDIKFVITARVVIKQEIIKTLDKWNIVLNMIRYLSEDTVLTDVLSYLKRIPQVEVFFETFSISEQVTYLSLKMLSEMISATDVVGLYWLISVTELVIVQDMLVKQVMSIETEEINILEETWKEFVARFFDIQILGDEIVQEFANIIQLTEVLSTNDVFVTMFIGTMSESLILTDRTSVLFMKIFHELTTLVDLKYMTILKLMDQTLTFEILMKHSCQLVISESTIVEDRLLEVAICTQNLKEILVLTDQISLITPVAYSCEIMISTIGSISIAFNTIATIQKTVSRIGSVEIEYE